MDANGKNLFARLLSEKEMWCDRDEGVTLAPSYCKDLRAEFRGTPPPRMALKVDTALPENKGKEVTLALVAVVA
eukprot:7960176-Lingulodinium_polyedra.AAC.1